MSKDKDKDEDPLNWRQVRSEDGADYGIFRMRFDWAVSPRTSLERRYVVLHCPVWINVIALTDDGHVVLIRQYRHGIEEVSLEIPAGMVQSDEEPLAAARRELAEETGYSGGEWTILGRARPNPAYQDNWCYSFLARGVRRTGEPHLDEGEAIAVDLQPLSDVWQLVRNGAINHALMLNAFYWLDTRERAQRALDTELDAEGCEPLTLDP